MFIEDFLNPRFSTEEFELSRTQCEFNHGVTSMYYDDHIPNLPTHVIGYIQPPAGAKLQLATWNRFGECTMEGLRVKSFDLVRPNHKYIAKTNLSIKVLLIGGILSALSLILN